MAVEGELNWGGGHPTQSTYDVLQSCTPEAYMILLKNVVTIHSINILKSNEWRNMK